MRALVVEDEVKMAALIRRGLVEEGYAADVARTGEDSLRATGWRTRCPGSTAVQTTT
jgi:DNA-binding response OmpR family regulator